MLEIDFECSIIYMKGAMLNEVYNAIYLPEAYGDISYHDFLEEIIDATAAFETYKEKIKDSKLDTARRN